MGHGSYAQKLLIMMLAEYHNPELDVAFPSIKELSRVCEMSPRTVRWCLRRLEAMGFITTKQKGNQYQRTEYALRITDAQISEAAMSGAAMVAPASEAAMSGILQGQGDASEAATPATTNRYEPIIEPSSKRERTITPEFIEELIVEFAPSFGGNGRVREAIEEALNHKAMDKRKDKRLYLRTWLRRDVGQYGGRNANAIPGGRLEAIRREAEEQQRRLASR